MSTDYASAKRMADAAAAHNIKLTVAHYRRQQPFFKHIKELLHDKVIGDIRLAWLELYKPALTPEELALSGNVWRTNPAIAGGGLFHDLAPHQLDLMYYFFGPVQKITGIAAQQGGQYAADDMVAGNILFKNGVAFSGAWCFNAPHNADYCEIIGSKGKIGFTIFSGTTIWLTIDNIQSSIQFDPLQHVQQPMIAATVQYFLSHADNPCSGEEGAEVMRMMGEMVLR
jgi:predicted dehydrogenase